MLEYHAAYYRIEDGWYLAKVLDFPGAISQGRTLRSARKMIRDSLIGLAEFVVENGDSLPSPDEGSYDKTAEFQEKIQLQIEVLVEGLHEKAKASPVSSAARVRLPQRRRKALHRL
jgi:predicted RNase H-like HicB family nuclease